MMTDSTGERLLEKELDIYARRFREWGDHEGQYVLIKWKGEEEEASCDFFSAYDDAIKIGYEKFGLEPFLVKQIRAIEQMHFISRDIFPCRTSHAN